MDKIKILIVEDESIIALNLKETLIELNYEPCGIAPNRCKTLLLLDKGANPDLILMDIYLKGNTTGIELAKELKSKLPYTPIVFLTANAELETIKEASEAFAYGYLIKPYKTSHLQAAIEMALQKSKNDVINIKKLDAVKNINKTLKHKLEKQSDSKIKIVQLKYGYLFDKEKNILYFGNDIVKLTSKETKVLQILCAVAGETISQEQIEYAIWQDEPAGYAAFRSVLFRLRNKVHKDLIGNQNNTGYKIAL